MKKGLVTVFILILFIGVASAGSCEPDQTIMKLYSSDNSHGALWNDSFYTYDICYNDIFDSRYNGERLHDCDEDNRILSLSSVTNAHASNESDLVYANDVCYGGMECEYELGSEDNGCENGGQVVVRMSDYSNAHISDALNMDYPIKVCCIAMPTIYWGDMDGNEIVEANLGDVVKMVVTGTSESTFEIFDDDGMLGRDEIRVESAGISGEVVENRVIGKWEITQADLDEASNFPLLEGFEGFYFEINDKRSDMLKVNVKRDDDPMSVAILSPECGDYFNKSTILKIEVDADDADNEIFGMISVNGENINFSNGGIILDEEFDSAGDFQIVVSVENSRGDEARAISNIMILDRDVDGTYTSNKNYTAACILEPKDYSNIDDSDVWFDASTTRGIKIDSSGDLKLLIPGQNLFSWYWEFNPGDEGVEKVYLGTDEERAYKFWWAFPVFGKNSATLRVEID